MLKWLKKTTKLIAYSSIYLGALVKTSLATSSVTACIWFSVSTLALVYTCLGALDFIFDYVDAQQAPEPT